MKCDVCNNRAKWFVNARYREANSAVCGKHLAACVSSLSTYNDPRAKRRASDHGVMVYPIRDARHSRRTPDRTGLMEGSCTVPLYYGSNDRYSIS